MKLLLLFLVINIGTLSLSQQPSTAKPVTFINPPKGPNTDHAKLTYGSFPQTPKPVTVAKAPTSFGAAPAPPVAQTPPPIPPKPQTVTTAPTGTTTTTTKRPSLISDNELREFSEELLSKDTNNAAKHVTINLQGKIERNDTSDKAPQPLMTVAPAAFNIPTIAKMMKLFDNYVQDAGVKEDVTPQEKQEENEFLDAIIPTATMQLAKKLLQSKGLIKDDADFKTNLQRIWFSLYEREPKKLGSSGFEHVFLSEVKKGQVQGVHNWIYFNAEEKNGHANYLGYIRNVDLGTKGALVKIRFKINGQVKALSTMFIGTSPEFEIALYTVCYMFRAEHHCPVKMNGTKFSIRTYNMRQGVVNSLASAFAELA